MAVGKGSMARASKAAAKKAGTKTVAEAAPKTGTVNEKTQAVPKEISKPASAKRTTAKKTAPKKETSVTASVVGATSEQVMREIVYQKSSQVLYREAEVNETFGVGEAMPIYFF